MWLTFLNHLKGKIIKKFMNYNKLISLLEDSNTAGQDWKSTLTFVLTNPKYDISK